MRTHPLRPNLVLALTCLLAILLFFLGLAVPGAHLWGSYLLPIVLAFLWGRRRDIYIVTALASLLMVVTFWTGGISTGGDFLTYHLLPILLLWAVVWLLAQRRQLQDNLDAQVTARTAALAASEAQLDKLFRANPGAIAITRQSDGCYLDANPAYLQLLGFTRDELVGRRGVDLGLLSAAARAEIVDRFKRGAAAVPFAVPLHTKTGATIDVMTAIDTIDFAGEPCYLSFMVDITARKQLEARARRLAALVDAAQDAIMSADLDGTIVTLNPSAEALYGTSAAAVVGQNMVRLTQPDYVAPLQEMLGRISQGEAATLDDIAWTLPDGSTRSLSIALSPIRDESGQVKGFASSARDVTARIQMAREVARLAAIVQSSNDAIISADLDGTLRSMNRAAEHLFGITAGEAVGQHISLINPDLPASERAAMFARLAAGELFMLPDLTWTTADGRCVDLSVTALPFLDPGGQVQGVASIARDITARKAAERTLRESEERFAHLFSSSPVGITLSRLADGRYLEANDAFLAMVGYSRDELVGRTSLELNVINPEDRLRLIAELQDQGRMRGTDLVVQTKGDKLLHTLYAVESLDLAGEPCLLSSIVDVTERRRLEAALRNSEARYRLLVDNAEDVIWTVDMEGRFTFVNPAVECQLGYRPEEVIGQRFDRWLTPDSAVGAMELFATAAAQVRTGQRPEIPQFEGEQIRKDGTQIFTYTASVPLLDEGGRPLGFLGISRDVTARKQLEDRLRDSEERFRLIVQNSPDVIALYNDQGVLAYVSPAVEEAYGISAEQALAFDPLLVEALITPPGEGPRAEELARIRALPPFADRRTTAEAVAFCLQHPGVQRHVAMSNTLPTGEVRHFDIAYQAHEHDGSRRQVVSIMRDVTERRRMEESLAASERKYRDLYDNSPDMYVSGYANGTFRDCNLTLAHKLGYTRVELLGLPTSTIFTPAAYSRVQAELPKHVDAGKWDNFEVQLHCKDGTVLDALLTAQFEPATPDHLPYSRVTLHDITERKRAERALTESERKYRDLYDNSPDMYFVGVPTQGLVLDCNQTLARTLGYTTEDLIGGPSSVLFTPASYRQMQAATDEFLAAGSYDNFEVQLCCRDGTLLDALLSATIELDPTGGPARARVTLHDITARKRLEEQLRDSEDRFRLIVQNSPDVIALYDEQGGMTYLSPSVEQAYGVSPEAVLAGDPLLLEAINTRPGEGPRADELARIRALPQFANRRIAAEAVAYCLQHPGELQRVEATSTLPSGAVRQFDTTCLAYESAGGRRKVVAMTRDVTARKQVEEALAASERKYRDLYDNSPDMYFVGIPTQGLILDCNQTLARTLGYAVDELIGGPSNVMFTPASYMQMQAARPGFLSAGKYDNFEVQLRHRDGTLLDALMSFTIESDPAGGPARARVTLHDITERKRAEVALAASEAQLRKSQARYQMLADYATDVIWTMDPAGDVTYVSPSSIRQSGFTPEETMCQTLDEAVAPSSRTALRSAVGELYGLIRSGQPVPATPNVYEMLRKDGTTYWGETIYSVAYNEQGEFQQLIGATREVTKRVSAERRLIEAYRRVQLAAETAGLGIWNWNVADNSLDWDDRMCELYGVTADERRQGIFYELWRARVHPDDLATAEPEQGDPTRVPSAWSGAYRIMLPGGEVRHILASSVTEYDAAGWPHRIIGVNRDITDQVHFERLLQDTNAELEERVAARTADLQAALAELQRASKLRDEFMAMISHELRTPLTGVLSMSEMLEDQVAGLLNARQAAYVKGITHSGERLLHVINGILDYTHVLSGRVKLDASPCALPYLLATCAASQQHKAAEKAQNIAVSVAPPNLTITADAIALAEVLKRLLDNAVKFTPKGGQIGLEANRGTTPNTVDLVVWDTGIGIPPDQHAIIFHAFTQADGRLSRSHEGIGIGLAYVHEMVRLMGGKIALESTPGEGSRFTITLAAR